MLVPSNVSLCIRLCVYALLHFPHRGKNAGSKALTFHSWRLPARVRQIFLLNDRMGIRHGATKKTNTFLLLRVEALNRRLPSFKYPSSTLNGKQLSRGKQLLILNRVINRVETAPDFLRLIHSNSLKGHNYLCS